MLDKLRIAMPFERFVGGTVDSLAASLLAIPALVVETGTTAWEVLLAAALLAPIPIFAVTEGTRGITPGKWFVGARVVDATSTDTLIGVRRAFVRRLMYYAGGLIFFIGWTMVLKGPKHQALHDRVARSLVVRAAASNTE